ncbi:MAG: transcriptional regulator, LysR family [Actinotalea sp.]|nr:transcriptional regulator, LysR family [Actinotalea sp.]
MHQSTSCFYGCISIAHVELDPRQLAALAAVVREGSFDAAAAALHVTPSAISQRIKALEQRSGQVLVRRVRPCTPTEAGQVLVRLAAQWALLETEAGEAATEALGPVRMAVAVNADSLATWFPSALAAMTRPVRFEVLREDQDHSARLLREGAVMAAVTTERRAVQGCRGVALGSMRYVPVAAPAFVLRWLPDGPTPEALAAAPVLAFNRKDALQSQFIDRVAPGLDPPVHHVPSNSAFVELIRRGLAWGMVPEGAARPELAAGLLQELAPGGHLDVPLYWQHWTVGSPVLEELTGHVRTAAREGLRQVA